MPSPSLDGAIFVHVWSGEFEVEIIDELVRRVADATERALPPIQGLLSVTTLVADPADGHARVLLASQWRDVHAWGRAQWETKIQDHMVWLFTAAKNIETHGFHEVFHFVTDGSSADRGR